MKKLLFLFLFSTSMLPLVAQVNADTEIETHIMEGLIRKRFGVYVDITVHNWDDLTEIPMKKQVGHLYLAVETKVKGKKEVNVEWKKTVKAEVYILDHDDEKVEVKLLEDFATKMKKLGLDGMQMKPGEKIQFRWEVGN